MRLEHCIRRWLGLKSHYVAEIQETAGRWWPRFRRWPTTCRGAGSAVGGWAGPRGGCRVGEWRDLKIA